MSTSTKELTPIIEWFYKWENETPDNVFLRQPSGATWKQFTYKEAGEEARKMASALKSKGLQKGDHVGILSKNCYHWILADLAIMMGGYVSVPFYASLPKDQLAEVVRISDIKMIFVGKLDKWGEKNKAIPSDVQAIKFPHYDGNATIDIGENWNDLIEHFQPNTDNYIPSLDDLWTIKFTSGTTGTPKGVMHIHRSPSIIMNMEEETGWIGVCNIGTPKYFSYLPLNHVGERMGVEVPCLYTGGNISFAESLETFAKNIGDTQPTLLFGVPRIWTKFYLGVLSKMPQKKLDLLFKIPIVSGIVKKKLRTALGLRDLKIAATGAAITPEFLKNWYSKLGIHLIEAYGMTEVCGSQCNSPMLDVPGDSVGKVIPGGAVKIDQDSGEILMSSPAMMTGYYKEPEKTAEVLIDGWMHSGDRGTIDDQGFVRVIGRVKDAFKTSKGSYVTPNPMEEVLAKNDHIEQCCVVGLGIPQPICLVNLSESAQKVDKTAVAQSLITDVKALNSTLANFEKISTVVINQDAWSEQNQLLTPTLKVRRGKLDDQFGQQYLQWHEDKENVIWA